MMEIEGNLRKMNSRYKNEGMAVDYYLPLNENSYFVNDWIGKNIRFHYTGQINCIKCGKRTKTSFQQGFCYNCFQTAPEADPAIIRPELDQAHLGISRDMEWAKKYSLVPHVVYLAVSSGLKVGVTRKENRFTRWVDQGAHRAIVLAETPNRNLAGQIEVVLKGHLADKTNWRKMLTGNIDMQTELVQAKQQATEFIPTTLDAYISADDTETVFQYPVTAYPAKVTSANFDKTPEFNAILTGIKGQYLLFENGAVINIRKYGGYLMNMKIY